jgi:hypothetical protein
MILTCGFPNSIFAALRGRHTARDRRSNASVYVPRRDDRIVGLVHPCTTSVERRRGFSSSSARCWWPLLHCRQESAARPQMACARAAWTPNDACFIPAERRHRLATLLPPAPLSSPLGSKSWAVPAPWKRWKRWKRDVMSRRESRDKPLAATWCFLPLPYKIGDVTVR